MLYTRDANGSLAYFHYDGQGKVVSVTEEARKEIAYYEYDAWGNILTECGSFSNEFAFSTKQASAGTGFIDFGYRWYDPTVGRWTQRDPIGLAGGVNLYDYAIGNPTNRIDLYGLDPNGTSWHNTDLGKFYDKFMELVAAKCPPRLFKIINEFWHSGSDIVARKPSAAEGGGTTTSKASYNTKTKTITIKSKDWKEAAKKNPCALYLTIGHEAWHHYANVKNLFKDDLIWDEVYAMTMEQLLTYCICEGATEYASYFAINDKGQVWVNVTGLISSVYDPYHKAYNIKRPRQDYTDCEDGIKRYLDFWKVARQKLRSYKIGGQ